MQDTLSDVANICNMIQEVLDEMQPLIARDGGRIELVRYHVGIVEVSLHGACVSCPMSLFTLKLGLEEQLQKRMPFIKEVKAI